MSPGWVGCHPSSSRVSALEAGASSPMKAAQPAEVLARVLGCDGDDRDLEMPSDDLRDVAERNALVGDRVERRSRRGLFEREAKEARRVERVHGGPAGRAVADVAGDAVLARRCRRGSAMKPCVAVAVVVGGSRTIDERTPRLARDERELRGFPRAADRRRRRPACLAPSSVRARVATCTLCASRASSRW